MILYVFFNILLSCLFSHLLIRFGKKVPPSERCSHTSPMVTSGGLIFVAMFFLNYLYFYLTASYQLPTPLLLGSILLIVVGIIDDHSPLSYKIRICVHVLVAACVIQSGYTVKFPFLDIYPVKFLEIFFTFFLVMGLINACNFFDGLNGLLSGCVILTLLFNFLFLKSDSTYILLIIIPLLIFYIYNALFSKIFMGDVGSTFIGFFLSVLALKNQQYNFISNQTAFIHKGLLYTLSPMLFAWFDILLTLLRRIIDERHIFSPWRDYIFHHLFEIGYSHIKISLFYMISVLYCSTITYLCINEYIPFVAGLTIYLVAQLYFTVVVFKKHHHLNNL